MGCDVMHSVIRLATYCLHLQGQPAGSFAIVSIYRHGRSLVIWFLIKHVFDIVAFDY